MNRKQQRAVDRCHRAMHALRRAEDAADKVFIGARVRILAGPYTGRTAMVRRVSTWMQFVYVELTDVASKRGNAFVNFATRKDGRRLYALAELEFIHE